MAGHVSRAYRRALAPAWRRAIRAAADDQTEDSSNRTALVIAPHPDDETFGCGATIARRAAAGTEVTVVIAADGRHAQSRSTQISDLDLAGIRRGEVEQACRSLGLPGGSLIQLGIEDTRVEFSYDLVVDRVRELIRDHQPDDIFTTSGRDWHVDHQTVSRAVRTAASAEGRPQILEFPIWWWIDGPWRPRPGHRRLGRALHLLGAPFESPLSMKPVSLSSDGFLDLKRAAIEDYESQTSNLTGEDNWHVMAPKMLDLFMGDEEIFFLIDRLAGVRLD